MNGSGSGRYLKIENVKARNSCIGTNTMGGFPYRWDFTIRSKAWIFYVSFFGMGGVYKINLVIFISFLKIW